MAATSETITDFNNIPGKLIDVDGTKIHEFPSIVSQTSSGKERFWTMYVAAEKNGKKISIHKDWYSSSGKPLTHAASVNGIIFIDFTDIITFYFTRQGQKNGKITTSARTYVKTGSNLGKSNETNVFTQALRDAYSKWKHKNKKSNYGGFKPPQLVVNLKDNLDRIDFSKYTYTVNRKYDGVRCLATIRPGIDKPKEFTDIVMYSRERHEFPDKYNDHRRIILSMILNKGDKWEKGRTLDGEIYAHGVSLQNISGSSRNTNITNIEDKLVYVVFDTFIQHYETAKVDEYNVPYSDRLKYIDELFKNYYTKQNINNFIENGESNPKVQIAPTWKPTSMDEVNKMYNDFVKAKYEGLILRRNDSPYVYSWNGYRNNGILRMKPTHTAEYPCIDYTEGQGKDKGAIIYICALSTMEPGINTTFNVMPKNMTDEERKERFIQAGRIDANGKTHFMNKYYSIPYTVEYQDLSDKGIPIRAKGIAFRDYE